ncbi:hypothetical protein EON76_04185 [bacterium]|nr:MAG: hypothetical protein EON76_04185 [bacterium]
MKQLSSKQLNQLRAILKDSLGQTYTDEELYSNGLAIVRFVLCIELHDVLNANIKKEKYEFEEAEQTDQKN